MPCGTIRCWASSPGSSKPGAPIAPRLLASHLLDDYDAVVKAACDARNRLVAETGRINTLCSYPWIPQVNA